MISPYLWLLIGFVMMLLEFVVPGLIIFFFGAGALFTGVASLLGLANSLESQLIIWIASSLGLILFLRRTVAKTFPSLEKREQSADDVIDRVGEVSEDVDGRSESGRVRFGGTTWKARSRSGEVIEKGATIRVVGRDNLTLYVERHNP